VPIQNLVSSKGLKKGRGFLPSNVKKKGPGYYGTARFARSMPDLRERNLKSLNLELTFDEALRLFLAVSSCMQDLNCYDRSTKKGRDLGLLLSVKSETSTIAVIGTRVKAEQ
jgi:hypothetical protein